MVLNFYYADLDIEVSLEDKKGKRLDGYSANERMALQQVIYLALNTFLYTKALFLSDDQQKGGD